MSYPAVPPPSEDPTAGLGSNRDGYTRSFEPPPPVDPYLPPVPPLPPPVSSPPVPAYQPPPAAPFQPPAQQYQPPAQQYQPSAQQYQPPAQQYQPAAPPPAPFQPSYVPPPAYGSQPFFPAAGGYPPPFPPLAATPPTSGWSVAALVLGIIGLLAWCTFGLPCLLAVIFGHLGLNETKLGAKSGRGMAIAGLILGYVGVAGAAAFFIWTIGSGAANTSP